MIFNIAAQGSTVNYAVMMTYLKQDCKFHVEEVRYQETEPYKYYVYVCKAPFWKFIEFCIANKRKPFKGKGDKHLSIAIG